MNILTVPSERIGQDATNRFLEEFAASESEYIQLTADEKTRVINAFFRQKTMTRNGTRTPYFDELERILQLTNMTYGDFFRMIGSPFQWEDPQIISLSQMLTGISEDESLLQKIARATQDMLPPIFKQNVWGWNPSDRIHSFRFNNLTAEQKKRLNKTYAKKAPAFVQERSRGRFPVELIPEFCNTYGISPYWVLCEPPSVPVIEKTVLIEKIIADFLFLSDRTKDIIYKFVEEVK